MSTESNAVPMVPRCLNIVNPKQASYCIVWLWFMLFSVWRCDLKQAKLWSKIAIVVCTVNIYLL